jgi:DMSO reductase anchor subunit
VALSPFGLAVTGRVWGVNAGWSWLETKKLKWQKLTCFALGGGLMAAYMTWAVYSDPVLSGWNKQNLTPSPPISDFLISFSPALLLAMVGIYGMIKRKLPYGRTLLIWIVLGCILLNIPLGLQRRFIVGFFIPVAGMALIGLDTIRGAWPKLYKWFNLSLIPLTIPTLILIIILPMVGIFQLNSWYYQTTQETQAFSWIAQNTRPDAIVLAAPDTGLILPALTGRRVIYGHPFETVNAVVEEQAVTDYFQAGRTAQQENDYLRTAKVAYVFYGPREQALGKPANLAQYPIAYQSGNVAVYAVNP